MSFQIGDTVKDTVFGETYCVVDTPGTYIEVLTWFTDSVTTYIPASGLLMYPCPPQPSEYLINYLTGCTHPRRTFIGLASGRWACAECGEWLSN